MLKINDKTSTYKNRILDFDFNVQTDGTLEIVRDYYTDDRALNLLRTEKFIE